MKSLSKPVASLSERKKLLVRETILDAAERLVRLGAGADLTMRRLAEEAGVSLSTLFKYFGSKGGILSGLADRMSEAIAEAYEKTLMDRTPVARVFTMANAGVKVVLSDPEYYKYVCRPNAPDEELERVVIRRRGPELWSLALEDDRFLRADLSGLHDTYVPQQLGLIYRGVLAMWMSGEIPDSSLASAVEAAIAGVLLGIVGDEQRPALVERITCFYRGPSALAATTV